MYVTVKLSYFEEEELLKLSELLEIPPREVLEILVKKMIKNKEILDELLNQFMYKGNTSYISISKRISGMPLVNCIECGSSVSDKAPTCPKCGVSGPSGKKLYGTLVIRREHRWWVARAVSIEIFVDRTRVGKVRNGEDLSINLPSGRHELTFSDWSGGIQDRQRYGAGGAMFQINTGETTVIQIRGGMRGTTITSSSNLS